MNKPEEFFNIFKYSHMMHDAIDGGLTYEDCEIIRDIQTSVGKLNKGDRFESIYFMFSEKTFEFCNWKEDPNPPHLCSVPDESSMYVPQSDLASYCHWEHYSEPHDDLNKMDFVKADQRYWSKHPLRRPMKDIVDNALSVDGIGNKKA